MYCDTDSLYSAFTSDNIDNWFPRTDTAENTKSDNRTPGLKLSLQVMVCVV